MRLHHRMFPQLRTKAWAYINLADDAPFPVKGHKNPLLDPEFCTKYVQQHQADMGIDHSFGGWMENRSRLWHGSYLGTEGAWHLGVDINVPAGTTVCMPFDAMLHSAETDPDQELGWGGKMIFQFSEDHYMIFGHLKIEYPCKDHYKYGDPIGVVGIYPDNGNVFPHVHVQAVWRRPGIHVQSVDGYSHLYEGIEDDFPHPEDVLYGWLPHLGKEEK